MRVSRALDTLTSMSGMARLQRKMYMEGAGCQDDQDVFQKGLMMPRDRKTSGLMKTCSQKLLLL